MVVRSRLIEQLNRGVAGPITLVCAAAGYGKTTLVSAWLGKEGSRNDAGIAIPAAWLSLDEYDGDLVVFLRYFCAAVRTVFPAACSHTLALLQAPQQAPVAELIATLSSEINSVGKDFVLVLEDYHVVTGTEVDALLAGLARHWPPALHLVLITRRDPLLPLAGLRAKGQLTEIRTRDLQFTTPEVEQYLIKVLGEYPSERMLQQLLQQTEGWIAGLHLALLSQKGKPPTAARERLAATDANIAEYLLSELLDQQPIDIVAFLLKTALLPRFCAPLCEHILVRDKDERPARACIEWLERTNFLIVALDDQHGWHRYHHLVQEFLISRATATFGLNQINDLHRQAADWFAQEGLTEEALHHALAAQDLARAATLMEQGLCAVLNRQDLATLRRWSNLLPMDFRRQRPGLLIIEAWVLYFSVQPAKLLGVLQQLEMLSVSGVEAETEPARLLLAQVLALRAMIAHFGNQPTVSIASVRHALALLPPSWAYVRALCWFWLGVCGQLSGQGEAFGRDLWSYYTAAPVKSDHDALGFLQALCMMRFADGSLVQVEQAAALLLEQSRRRGSIMEEGWAHYYLGLVAYEWGELQTAVRHLLEVADTRYSLHTFLVRDGLSALVKMQTALGDATGAQKTLDILKQYEYDVLGYETPEMGAARAWLDCRHGNNLRAYLWVDAFVAPVPDQPQHQTHNAHYVKAWLLLQRNEPADTDKALDLIATLFTIAQRTCNRRLSIALLALQAVALDVQGQEDAALTTLAKSLGLDESGSFVRTFVDLGARMQSLLDRLGKHRAVPASLPRILAGFSARAPGGIQPANALSTTILREPLTMREIDILVLMRARLSNKEIARKLSIAVTTVERHAANAYGKLDVRRRLDAISKAEALGLLPPR